jgi:hypothetical protein
MKAEGISVLNKVLLCTLWCLLLRKECRNTAYSREGRGDLLKLLLREYWKKAIEGM